MQAIVAIPLALGVVASGAYAFGRPWTEDVNGDSHFQDNAARGDRMASTIIAGAAGLVVGTPIAGLLSARLGAGMASMAGGVLLGGILGGIASGITASVVSGPRTGHYG